MNKSIIASVFISIVVTMSYAIGALPGYFWYYAKKGQHKHYGSDIALLLTPFMLYIGLHWIEDRQGFFLPVGLLLIGLIVSIYFAGCYYFPAIDGHHIAVACLIAGVLACWIFFPESGMKLT
jgi:hypothetical protein